MKLLIVLALACMAASSPLSQDWTLQELSEAIQSPATNPAELPYLEHALNEMMQAIWDGKPVDTVVVTMPVIVESTPVEVMPVVPSPVGVVDVMPVVSTPVFEVPIKPAQGSNPLKPTPIASNPLRPNPVPTQVPAIAAPMATPVRPVSAGAASSASSPLVQIILNINQQASESVSPASVADAIVDSLLPVPVVESAPTPVTVVDGPSAPVHPVVVVEQPTVVDPVVIVEPEVNPIDVIAVAAPEPNPIDVIAVAAPEPNPIDVIAVAAPEPNPIDIIAVAAPEVNPIDLLQPLVPVPAGSGSQVGALE